MSTGDVVRSVIVGGQLGVPIVNTFHFFMGIGSPAPDLSGMAVTFGSVYVSALLGSSSVHYHIDTVIHTVVAGPNKGMQFIDNSASGSPGSITGTTLPSTVCAVLLRTAGFATRSSRGRVFLSPVPSTAFDATGAPVTPITNISTLLAAIVTFVVDTAGNGYLPCLFNTKTGAVLQVVNAVLSARAGNQRRRREAI